MDRNWIVSIFKIYGAHIRIGLYELGTCMDRIHLKMVICNQFVQFFQIKYHSECFIFLLSKKKSQQFARVMQKSRVDLSKSHAWCKNKLQSNKLLRMVTQAYWNLARVYVDSRSRETKCEVLYRATLRYVFLSFELKKTDYYYCLKKPCILQLCGSFH